MSSAPQSPMMPNFIQAMYGTVIGVGSLEYVFNFKVLADSIFQFLFFGFTILIIAHDWYVFHKLERKSDEKFWPFTFQVGSLFFLAQMMYAAKGMKLPPCSDLPLIERLKSVPMFQWYVYGLIYTLFNMLSKETLKENQVPNHVHNIIYRSHFGICIVTILLLCTFHFPAFFAYTWLFFTIIIVIFLWEYREREMKKMRAAQPAIPVPSKAVQLDLPKPPTFEKLEPFLIPNYPNTLVALDRLKLIEIFEAAEKANAGTGVNEAVKKASPDPVLTNFALSLTQATIQQRRKEAIHDLFTP